MAETTELMTVDNICNRVYIISLLAMMRSLVAAA